jgi:TonB family protein
MQLVIALLLAGIISPASVFPRQQTPPAESPVPTSKVLSTYPAIAVAQKVSGAVLVDVIVNTNGKISDASVVSGPTLLRSPAKKAALLWRFEPLKGAGESRSVRLTFIFHEPSYKAPEKAPDFTCPYQVEVEWTAAVDSFKD